MRHVKLWLTTIAVLLCSITKMSGEVVLTEENGLLNTLSANSAGRYQYVYTSPMFTVDEATNTLTFTFLEGYTRSNSLNAPNGYPFVAFSEFYLYDGDGNEVALDASNFSTNAQETREGPIANICDKDRTTFFHSLWSAGASDYHNLVITLPEGMELQEFRFKYYTRWESHGIPKKFSIEASNGEISYGTEVIADGTCGDNLTWELTYDGNLAISGSGLMYDYNYSYVNNTLPWSDYREILKNVTMAEGITTVGCNAFYDCVNLTSVVIPKSVTAIKDYAFTHCNELTEVDIPEGVEEIGYRAFLNCYRLPSVLIPKTVYSIGEDAFAYCKNLSSIVVDEENPNYDSRNNCNAIIETNSNTIVRGTANTVIPESVRNIGELAFSGCDFLSSVSIPEGVESIGLLAFSQCYSLTTVVIPQSVNSISSRAFYGCKSLSQIKSLAVTPPALQETDVFSGVNKNACTLISRRQQGCLSDSRWLE